MGLSKPPEKFGLRIMLFSLAQFSFLYRFFRGSKFIRGLIYHVDSPSHPQRFQLTTGPAYFKGWAFNAKTGKSVNFRIGRLKGFHTPIPNVRNDVQKTFTSENVQVSPDTGFKVDLNFGFGIHPVTVEAQTPDGEWIILRRQIIISLSFLAPRLVEDLCYHIDSPSHPSRIHLTTEPLIVKGWAFAVKTGAPVDIRVRHYGEIKAAAPQARRDVRNLFYKNTQTVSALTGFETIIDLNLGIHFIALEAKMPNKDCNVLRRIIVISIPFLAQKKMDYQGWVSLESKILKNEIPEFQKHIKIMFFKPLFSIILDAREDEQIEQTVKSIQNQIYPNWDLLILASEGKINKFSYTNQNNIRVVSRVNPNKIKGDYLVFIQARDSVSPKMLYEFANALNISPNLELIYSDEDFITSSGKRCRPFHKPSWSPDYLEAFNYIGNAACFCKKIAKQCFNLNSYYDFLLRFTEKAHFISHIDQILYHRLQRSTGNGYESHSTSNNDDESSTAILGRLKRTGRKGQIISKGSPYPNEIQIQLKSNPLVSIVIPTAGKIATVNGRETDLLLNCVSNILDKSTYQNIEIIIVDNGNIPEKRMDILKKRNCKFFTYKKRNINIPAKLNLGVSQSKGDILILLNDDTEIITLNWIERMLEHFEKEHVGVVGVKLLYVNQLIQHAGVVHNHGNPDHVRRYFPRDDSGFFFSTCCVRNFMAVTGACMMTPTSLYRKVRGYSEDLAVSFNDVDYCMKLRALGFYAVYTPHVEMFHFESLSRKAECDERELHIYHKRWALDLASDPFYNDKFLEVAPPTFEPHINHRQF